MRKSIVAAVVLVAALLSGCEMFLTDKATTTGSVRASLILDVVNPGDYVLVRVTDYVPVMVESAAAHGRAMAVIASTTFVNFSSTSLSRVLKSIPPGDYTVTATVYDSTDTQTATDFVVVTVTKGRTVEASISLVQSPPV